MADRGPRGGARIALVSGRGWIALTLLLLAACSDEPPEPEPIACTDTRDCPGGQFCSCQGVCFTPAPCRDDADCCANQTCTDGLCLDTIACGGDAECGGGLVCRGCVCVPSACATDGECAEAEVCDGGLCLDADELPCQGRCGPVTVCSPVNQLCVPTPPSCAGLECAPGEVVILEGLEEHLGPVCVESPRCVCSSARPVPVGWMGTDMSVVHLSGRQFGVLAHDHLYGDLVYRRLEAGATTPGDDDTYIDGVPDAPPEGDPAGRRGGVRAIGPDRGANPAAARAADGTMGVSYYDVDQGDLLFARGGVDGASPWTASAVETEGDAGQFSDLVALPDGRWAIAYFAGLVDRSWLRLAVSQTAAPLGPTDWQIATLDEATTEEEGAGDLPVGTGLFPSAALVQGDLWVAFYNGVDGSLRLARGPVGGPFEVFILDEGTTRSELIEAGDVGRHVSLAVAPAGTVAVAYQDAISGALWFAELEATGPPGGGEVTLGEPRLVDPGRQMSPPALVGADLQLRFRNNGQPVVIYQDSTNGDLLLAQRIDERWDTTPVVRQQVAGFSPHFFEVGGEVWVIHGVVVDEGDGNLVETIDARQVPF